MMVNTAMVEKSVGRRADCEEVAFLVPHSAMTDFSVTVRKVVRKPRRKAYALLVPHPAMKANVMKILIVVKERVSR
jgi:hypothetical protein